MSTSCRSAFDTLPIGMPRGKSDSPFEIVKPDVATVVFSVTRPGLAVLTVQFKVGEDRIAALVRLHDTLQANRDWVPTHLGVGDPIVKPAQAIRELRTGELIEALATDPGSVPDFEAWCTTTGNELVERSESEDVFRFVIRKK